jgi:hypothetical protein
MIKESKEKLARQSSKRSQGEMDRRVAILAAVVDKYLKSGHFNGLPIRELKQFLIDRKGIVRWINIEGAKDGLAGLERFPSDEEFLLAARQHVG